MKKRYIILITVILILSVILFFLSSIVKNWVVKNSEELTGRKIEISELHFNYLKVSVQAEKVAVYEKNKTDHFISFRELYVDFDPWKLLQKEYSFSKVSLDSLQVGIIQNSTGFNFDDLIPAEDSSEVTPTDTTTSDLKFSIYNISITNSDIKYIDKTINNDIEINNLNLELPLVAWNLNQSDVGAKFNIGEQGIVEANAIVDNKQNSYQLKLNTTNVSLQPVAVYLKDYADIGALEGLLTSEIQINGDMVDYMKLSVSGKGNITHLLVKDGSSENIIEAEEVKANIRELNLATSHYHFSDIELYQPHIIVKRDKETTNLERFLLPYFQSDSISNTTEITVSGGSSASEETELSYKIDTVKIEQGRISFADNSINRPFYSSISDFNMTMLGLTESATHIPVNFSAKLNENGTFEGETVFNMLEPMEFEFNGQLKRLNLVNFSPYSEFYIASPVTQGWFNYGLQIKMTPKWLKNKNKIKIEELEFGKKTPEKAQLKVPLKLGLYILKDVNDNITIDMPVSGSTSDPKFKLGRLIWKTFTNLMIKTAASPFNALSGLVGTNPEKLEYLKFSFTQDSLDERQISTLTSLTQIIKKKPDLAVIFNQRTDEDLEKKELSIKLAKEKYITEKSLQVIPENSDTTFLAFIRQQVPELDSIGIEKACSQFLTPGEVNNRFRALLSHRNQLIHDFFSGQGLPEESIQVSTSDLKTLPGELRKPEYKIEVSLK